MANMEMTTKEIQVVERAVADQQVIAIKELQELQLSLVGGGCASVDFA